MDKLTDFTDTSDVSDAAIEWVTSHGNRNYDDVKRIRKNASDGFSEDCAIIIAARLIQQHRPDLLVDPVDAIVREELAKAYEEEGLTAVAAAQRAGERDSYNFCKAAKRLYLMGIAKGKSES